MSDAEEARLRIWQTIVTCRDKFRSTKIYQQVHLFPLLLLISHYRLYRKNKVQENIFKIRFRRISVESRRRYPQINNKNISKKSHSIESQDMCALIHNYCIEDITVFSGVSIRMGNPRSYQQLSLKWGYPSLLRNKYHNGEPKILLVMQP